MAIDAHPSVVRFNAYQTKGYERHTGIKTTHWFTVLTAKGAGWRAVQPYEEIWVHSWQPDPAKCQTFRSYETENVSSRFAKIPHEIINDLTSHSGFNHKAWSTGLIAIWMMLKKVDKIALAGFDWWDREKHHYCDKAARGTLHKPELEKVVIDRWVSQNRVRFI